MNKLHIIKSIKIFKKKEKKKCIQYIYIKKYLSLFRSPHCSINNNQSINVLNCATWCLDPTTLHCCTSLCFHTSIELKAKRCKESFRDYLQTNVQIFLVTSLLASTEALCFSFHVPTGLSVSITGLTRADNREIGNILHFEQF